MKICHRACISVLTNNDLMTDAYIKGIVCFRAYRALLAAWDTWSAGLRLNLQACDLICRLVI